MPTPTARELYAAGRLDAAIETLGAELRDHPTDAQRRSFLFELLSLAGQYDRAEKQLDVLARGGPQAAAGTMLYRTALDAERQREQMFAAGAYPSTPAAAGIAGTRDGRPFLGVADPMGPFVTFAAPAMPGISIGPLDRDRMPEFDKRFLSPMIEEALPSDGI